MEYAVIITTRDGRQMCNSGFNRLEQAIKHMNERVISTKDILTFTIIGPDGLCTQHYSNGDTISGRNQIQAWYKAEKNCVQS